MVKFSLSETVTSKLTALHIAHLSKIDKNPNILKKLKEIIDIKVIEDIYTFLEKSKDEKKTIQEKILELFEDGPLICEWLSPRNPRNPNLGKKPRYVS